MQGTYEGSPGLAGSSARAPGRSWCPGGRPGASERGEALVTARPEPPLLSCNMRQAARRRSPRHSWLWIGTSPEPRLETGPLQEVAEATKKKDPPYNSLQPRVPGETAHLCVCGVLDGDPQLHLWQQKSSARAAAGTERRTRRQRDPEAQRRRGTQTYRDTMGTCKVGGDHADASPGLGPRAGAAPEGIGRATPPCAAPERTRADPPSSPSPPPLLPLSSRLLSSRFPRLPLLSSSSLSVSFVPFSMLTGARVPALLGTGTPVALPRHATPDSTLLSRPSRASRKCYKHTDTRPCNKCLAFGISSERPVLRVLVLLSTFVLKPVCADAWCSPPTPFLPRRKPPTPRTRPHLKRASANPEGV